MDVVDPQQVKDIVDLVLAGPIRTGASDACAPVIVSHGYLTVVQVLLSYNLTFHMRDGTIVERHYHPSDGALRGPIYVQDLRALMDEVFESAGIRFDDCGPDSRP